MISEAPVFHALLTQEERSAIAEVEATTSVLALITRMTQMRFAAIAKFHETDWVVCSVHDTGDFGINAGDILPLEITLCSEFLTDPQALLLPSIKTSLKHGMRAVVKRYDLESYAGVPIFLPDGTLYGALCAFDSRSVAFESPELAECLGLFARLVGCIFYGSGYLDKPDKFSPC